MLRVGIMLDSFTTSAWVASIVHEIQRSSFAEVSLVVLNTPPAGQPRPSFKKRLRTHWKQTLFHTYERWDYRRNKGKFDAKADTDLRASLELIPLLQVSPRREGFSDYFGDDDIAAVQAANLDVLFRFGFRILRGSILDAARYGVWSFHHDDNLAYRGGPPLFWEIYEGNPVSGTILQVLTSALDGGRVLCRGHSATDQRSLYRNRNPIYWKTAQYALRRLSDLDSRGWRYLQSLPTYNEAPARGKIYRTPHTGQMLSFLTRLFARELRAKLHSRLHGGFSQWFLAIRPYSAERTFDDAEGYAILPTPPDRFYADPCLLEKDGVTWLFFEDYRYVEGRAVICCSRLADDGTPGEPFEVLRRPYHLSYPYVFDADGVTYMIPETRENGTVELYRAEQFPTQWVLDRVLLEGVAAVDATIHRAGDTWWMFVGLASGGNYSTCDELALFYADSVQGPWTPHRNNPIVSDVRRARPAGPLFADRGRWIRPSQDCAERYGYAVNFNEVVTLNEFEYEERQIGRLEPGWAEGNRGTHTYARSSKFEVIDGHRAKKLLPNQRPPR